MALPWAGPPLRAAPGGDAPTPPVCAVVADDSLSGTPAVALLEVGLSTNSRVSLVERDQIDKILAERELQLAFSPGETAVRMRLGRLVRADLLLLLKGGPYEGEDCVRAAVAQTRTGLRLVVRDVMLSGDPQKDADALEQVLEEALPLNGRRGLQVVAVPPLVSGDLVHKYDYLQAAYARLLESALMRQNGVVVAELEEARAIGEEYGLTDPGGAVQRTLPLYVLGEYRNTTGEGGPRTTVRIELRRGDVALDEAEGKDLPAGQVAAFLVSNATRMVSISSGRPQALPTSDAETRELAERARAFSRIGNWQEALDLTEAGLLLGPDEPSLQSAAVRTISSLMWSAVYSEPTSLQFRHEAEEAMQRYRLGLEHLERAFAMALRDGELTGCSIPGFADSITPLLRVIPRESDLWAGATELLRERDRAFLRMFLAAAESAHRGLVQSAADQLFNSHTWLDDDWPTEEQDKLTAIRALSDVPNPGWIIDRIAGKGVGPDEWVAPEFQEFVAQLRGLGQPGAAFAARQLQVEIDKERAARARRLAQEPGETSQLEPMDSSEVVLAHLKLAYAPDGKPLHRDDPIRGWMAVGPDLDVAWDSRCLYRMRSPGSLELLYDPGADSGFSLLLPCYDGRFVWAPFMGPSPLIVAIDPRTQQETAFTERDGLPEAATVAMLAPLGGGEVCAAASIGRWPANRSWIGVLSLDGEAARGFRLILEAVRPYDETGAQDAQRTDSGIAFFPRGMVSLVDPLDPSHRRVLVDRQIPRLGGRPLLVDPADWSASVLPAVGGLSHRADYVTVHDGAAYALFDDDEYGASLWHVGFPDFTPHILPARIPAPWGGQVVFYEGRVHVVGYRWCVADQLEGPYRLLRSSRLPGDALSRCVCHSSHYGLVFIDTGQGVVYQPQFHLSPTQTEARVVRDAPTVE